MTNRRIPNGVDLFCRVIDHYGDAGTSWRLARELRRVLAHECAIRLVVDAPELVLALAGDEGTQGIEIIPWREPFSLPGNGAAAPWVIEMFGCDLPSCCLKEDGGGRRLILNLEYFSCEDWALDFHLRESLLGREDLRKFFFMPGLDPAGGGIMSLSRPCGPESDRLPARRDWLASRGVDPGLADMRWLIVYAYRGPWDGLLRTLSRDSRNWGVWALGEGVQREMKASCSDWAAADPKRWGSALSRGGCTVLFPPFLAQRAFDTLLCLSDFSLVRGEDSLAGALLSGRPFLWQLYPQPEELLRRKMDAFLKALDPVWSDEERRDGFKGFMDSFNFPGKGVDLDWDRVLDMGEGMGRDLSEFSSRLRTSCNLTEKLVQFASFFFRGEIT